MRAVRWADSAIADVAAIRARLDARRPDAAQGVIDSIVLATDWLSGLPRAGALVGYRRLRKWRVGQTGYLLFYEPARLGLAVVRVLHERSDWRSIVE